MSRSLTEVATHDLRSLLDKIRQGQGRFPLSRTELQSMGHRTSADALATALAGLDRVGSEAVLELLLADRRGKQLPDLDLVWTGPEATAASSRDTAVVVRQLFESARRFVLVGGYSFDHGKEILKPLHQVMQQYGVQARFFLDIEGQAESMDEVHAYATTRIDDFLEENWPFGDPRPEIYYDPRTVRPDLYASLHAKCIAIDEARTLVTSANFTSRAQTRNIELGVLIEDPRFTQRVVAHWNNLVSMGLMVLYRG